MNQAMFFIQPVKTEKSTKGAQGGKFTFWVNPDASKYQIKEVVEKLFSVSVISVQTVHKPGKNRRSGRTTRKLSDQKKAIVTLAEGQSIDLFDVEKKGKKK